ncbi:PQQ-binding-like beta-propeller repeat protein [Streptomyces sp. NPDC058486]|uniref:outer membrane protein assembly factor BamB family protein n=1 Tax=unclassified Streptomyces TaxID=2593676 RepID=UPI00365CF6D8
MTGLRGTVGAVAALLAATALGAALVLLAGFVYQLLYGDAPGAMLVWSLGLMFLAALLFALFGSMLPDEEAEERPQEEKAEGKQEEKPDAPSEPAPDNWLDVAAFCCVVLGLVAGGPFGIAGYEALRTETKTAAAPPPTQAASPSPSPSHRDGAVAWTVPPVGGPYDTGPGAWALGDAVAQVRLDGVSAYAVRDGAVRWNVPAPARESVCAMSRHVGANIGLVAFGRHEKPCKTLAAVHTSTGQVLWRQPVGGAGLAPYGLAVGGPTAVAAEDRVVRGRSAETGEQRWQRALGRDCAVLALDADTSRALLVEQCGSGARLVALEPRTGREQWTRALPVESEAAAAVISVTPAVVSVHEDDPRGTRALLAFDERGAPTATVPHSGPTGSLAVPEQVSITGEWGTPVVTGDRLVAAAGDKVVAFSLKDGRTTWQYTPKGTRPAALALEPDGRIGVLLPREGAEVVLLDPTTGSPSATTSTKDEAATVSIRPLLLPTPQGHIITNRLATPPQPALFPLH